MIFYKEQFKTFRKEKKIKLVDLAEKLQVNRNTLWMWESGRTIPAEKMVRFAAKLLEVPVETISDLNPAQPYTEQIDSEYVNALVSNMSRIDIGNLSNMQTYFLDKLNSQFNEMNSIVSLICTFLNSIPIICYAKDVNGEFTIANNAFLTNVSLDNKYRVAGKIDSDFFSKQEARKNMCEDEKVILTGESILNREEYIIGSRKKRWGLTSKMPILDSSGNIVGMVGYILDITKRKKSERKNKAFINALQNMDDPIWVALSAEDKQSGSILFDKFLYHTQNKFFRKIFSEKELLLSTKELYELVQEKIVGYHDKKKYTLDELKKNGKLIMKLAIEGNDGSVYNVINKIYYDHKNELFTIITTDDVEENTVQRITDKLRCEGIDEAVINRVIQ